MTVELSVPDFLRTAAAIEAEVGRVIVGQAGLLRGVVISLIAGGHALVEGVPGLGKTLLIRTLADSLDLHFSRIQFTPDLMPADIVGTNVLTEGERRHGGSPHLHFSFQPGPIFANLVLADEINRATPKTQSALLEAMQEKTVTVGTLGDDGPFRATDDGGRTTDAGRWRADDAPPSLSHAHSPSATGATRPLPRPFFVLATQNPIELEGTYPLPEAQLDRFFLKLRAVSPTVAELESILDRTTSNDSAQVRQVASGELLLQMQRLAREVPVAAPVRNYVARLIVASHPDSDSAPEVVKRYVRFGSSPRGGQALVLAGKITALLAGRYNVAFDDVRRVAPAALRHRLILNVEAQVAGVEPDAVVADLLRAVPETAK